MNISAPFIARPIATALLMVGLLLAGLTAYPLLPVAALPNVNYPTLQVTAQLPGTDPQTMASSVATPLETQFRVCSSRSASSTDAFIAFPSAASTSCSPSTKPASRLCCGIVSSPCW
jgi:multidrug efflux pump subunit AcrB